VSHALVQVCESPLRQVSPRRIGALIDVEPPELVGSTLWTSSASASPVVHHVSTLGHGNSECPGPSEWSPLSAFSTRRTFTHRSRKEVWRAECDRPGIVIVR